MPTALERPLPIRARPDLVVQPLEAGGRRYFGVKDPVTLKYYQLREEEHAILQMLDGEASLESIRRKFERQFSPKRLQPAQLQAFLGMLHNEGLVFSESTGQSVQLLERHSKLQRKRMFAAVSNPLAIRFRGIDPEPFLEALEPFCRWMFSAFAAVLWLGLVASAVGLVIVQFDALLARMPDFQAFFGLRNLAWLGATLAFTKVLHELGHGLACRRFGGECHEMGVMLLVFTPALYCNVSDAWMMPNKWHRILVSAAGMIVELALAAVATWLWWFSEPGILNALCLNVMFICSTTTLLFNGNPLLRYDGYYILSDLVEVPNLREQSQAVVRQVLGKFFLGMDLHSERMLPPRGHAFLFFYGIAATLYGWLVLVGILWFLHLVLKQWQLEVLAQWVAMLTVGSQVMVVATRTAKFVSSTARREKVAWGRFWLRSALVTAIVAGVLFAPLPYPLTAPAVLQPRNATRVYVSYGGRLTSAVEVGAKVNAGDTLAVLDSPEVRLDIAKLDGEKSKLEVRLKQIQLQQGANPDIAAQLDVTREALADVTQRLQERRKDFDRLTLTAPVSGTVLPARARRERPAEGDLPGWNGDPLDPLNRGATLAAGTMLCVIGDPAVHEAVLVVDQGDIDLVGRGQTVVLHLDEHPGLGIEGTIEEIAQVELQSAPSELTAQGDLATRTGASGTTELRSTAYQARVRLENAPTNITANASGWASIRVAPQSLFTHAFRYIARTFRFEAAQ